MVGKGRVMLAALGALFIFVSMPLFVSCAQMSGSADEGSGAAASEAPVSQPSMITFEFPDLPIPVELKKVEDQTMMLMTPNFQGGTLVLRGKVSVDSLVDFFSKSLPKYGWELTGTLNAKRRFLAFTKGRAAHCLIQIYDTSMGLNTEVQIWIIEPLNQN